MEQVAKLVIRDLHKTFGDHEVLKGISLDANAGDVISIIGSSGSGKVPCCVVSTFRTTEQWYD